METKIQENEATLKEYETAMDELEETHKNVSTRLLLCHFDYYFFTDEQLAGHGRENWQSREGVRRTRETFDAD